VVWESQSQILGVHARNTSSLIAIGSLSKGGGSENGFSFRVREKPEQSLGEDLFGGSKWIPPKKERRHRRLLGVCSKR